MARDIVNLTLSVDSQVAERARRISQSMGKSLNQVVREYLEQLAGQDQIERDCEEFRRLSMLSGGDSRGWKFSRDELHERP
jgi:hypothetical protein